MKQSINIGTNIDIPNLLETRMLIQGNSGAGKGSVVRGIIEQGGDKVAFILFDWAGEYYTLKEINGDIIIVGGQYGDVSILRTEHGKQVANYDLAKSLPKFIIENRLSVIVDLSDLKMGERIRFVRIFLEIMIELPQKYWVPYLVFLEECHKLCGEQDKQESAQAVKDLMSLGRKQGYCGIPITQRIAKLHKDVAAECNNKFIGRTFLDIDMDRAAKELGFSSSKDRLVLRDLKPGEFYAFGTSIKPNYVHKLKVNMPRSKMPKAGTDMSIKPKKPTAEIMATLGKLIDLPKKEKDLKKSDSPVATDNKAITSKEMQLVAKKLETMQSLLDKSNANNKLLLDQIAVLRKNEKTLKTGMKKVQQMALALKGPVISLSAIFESTLFDTEDIPNTVVSGMQPSEKLNQYAGPVAIHTQAPVSRKPATEQSQAFVDGQKLPKGEETVLRCVASYTSGVTRQSITVITGYTRRTRDMYIQGLRQKQLIDQSGDFIVANEMGLSALGDSFEALPKGDELYNYWLRKLPTGERTILEVIHRAFPMEITRDEISNETNYTRRTRDMYLQQMIHKQIIEVHGKGQVIASRLLFD